MIRRYCKETGSPWVGPGEVYGGMEKIGAPYIKMEIDTKSLC
jgi:hypothetical protein